LFNIIERICDITGLQQICGVIDGTHIPSNAKPNKQITSLVAYFYNRKRFHIIVLQVVCKMKIWALWDFVVIFFWNACAGQQGGVAHRGHFKMSSLYCFI